MAEELGTSTSRDQRTIDTQHLKLLSLFHYIGAGFALLGLIFLGLHYLMFSTVMSNPDVWKGSASAAPPPQEFWQIMKWFYAVFGALMVSSLVLNVLAGIYLRAKKHRTFCIVVAALNCLEMPFGTILGIFTLVVLARASVREAFAPPAYGIDSIG